MNSKQTPFHIAVDGNEANVTHRVGSNEYAYQILVSLEKISRNSKTRWTIFLTNYPVDDMPAERKGWRYVQIRPKKFATQWALPIALFKARKSIDVFFTPGHYAPRLCPVPYVSSVMDLAYLDFPYQFKSMDYYQLKYWTAYSVRNAQHIIAISNATKADVIEKYTVEPDKITVAYPALSTQLAQSVSARTQRITLEKFHITKPYILYVGTIQPRKNLIRLIQAFEALKRKTQKNELEKNLQLVIAGKVGWLAKDILQTIAHATYKDDIILTGYVTEQEKKVLYTNAQCSVLIGLHEGFGMPALESIFCGTIPVVSNTTSLPEVVGEAGILVNPMIVKSIAKGISRTLSISPEDKEQWKKGAKEQVEKFSWDVSAQRILDVLLKIIETQTIGKEPTSPTSYE